MHARQCNITIRVTEVSELPLMAPTPTRPLRRSTLGAGMLPSGWLASTVRLGSLSVRSYLPAGVGYVNGNYNTD
jgi:hypothetical protein